MGIEYELKFRATPKNQAQLRRELPGQEQQLTMETTYYDTPDRALSRQYCTLRRRLENGVSVCTLKTPAGSLGRQEFELEAPDIRDALPQLSALSGIPLEGLTITPVCGAKFTRIAKTVVTPECTVEIALDQGVLIGGGRELPLCEVEVELKSGDVRYCDLFAKTLAARFGLKQEPKSKFRRALALYRGE